MDLGSKPLSLTRVQLPYYLTTAREGNHFYVLSDYLHNYLVSSACFGYREQELNISVLKSIVYSQFMSYLFCLFRYRYKYWK